MPHPYWEPEEPGTEYKLPEQKQHEITPRTVGPAAPIRREKHLPNPPRARDIKNKPVIHPEYTQEKVHPYWRTPATKPPPRRGAVRPPRTVGPTAPRNVGERGKRLE